MYGLRTISQIPEVFSVDIQSGLLAKIVRTKENGGFFPTNLITELDWFFTNFDCNLAAKGMFELSEVSMHYELASVLHFIFFVFLFSLLKIMQGKSTSVQTKL